MGAASVYYTLVTSILAIMLTKKKTRSSTKGMYVPEHSTPPSLVLNYLILVYHF